jgi:hypothetical protein
MYFLHRYDEFMFIYLTNNKYPKTTFSILKGYVLNKNMINLLLLHVLTYLVKSTSTNSLTIMKLKKTLNWKL